MNKYGFIPFCEKNSDILLNCIWLASKSIPPEMNRPDYRFQISNLYCHSIVKKFSLGGEGGTLRPNYEPGSDLVFCDQDKISVKIQKEIFQFQKKNGSLSKPKSLVLKNSLGNNASTDNYEANFDYLLSIHRGEIENGVIQIGFGALSSAKVKAFLIPKPSADQISCQINNADYEYFSGLREYALEANRDRDTDLNRIFKTGLAKVYDDILALE